MNRFLHGMTRAVAESFSLPEPIVEIGSYQVASQAEIADLRGLFPNKEYLGIDMRPGPGVDLVDDVESLSLLNHSVGTVLALSTLEHVRHFWRAFEEIHRVLRPDGALLICCPFHFHIHSYPSDYWRFTPEALKLMLEPYPQKIIGYHGPRTRPANVWALAFREEHPMIDPRAYEHYRERMRLHAKEPLAWGRRLRYGLGRILCGRRPFAPHLDREKWETELLHSDFSESLVTPRRAEEAAR